MKPRCAVALAAIGCAAALWGTGAHAEARPETCTYATVDGHSGRRVCVGAQAGSDGVAEAGEALRPDEASAASPDARSEPGSATPERNTHGNGAALATGGTAGSTRVFAVEADAPVFENGEVPSAAPALERMRRYVAQCAAGGQRERAADPRVESGAFAPSLPVRRSAGPSRSANRRTAGHRERSRERAGISRPVETQEPSQPSRVPASALAPADPAAERRMRTPASLQVSFLVRAPGRAEGVSVTPQGAVSEELRRCVTSGLSGRMVGSPSSDAVGVLVTFRLHPDKKQ